MLTAMSLLTMHLPIWTLAFLPRRSRPHHEWSVRQAVVNMALRFFLRTITVIKAQSPLSLNQGAEKNRFLVMKPADRAFYDGGISDPDIQPESIGGT